MSSFAGFIAPFSSVEFKQHYYGRKPLQIARNGAAFDNPMPWERFNQVLGLTPYWNEDTLKVSYKSRSALRENYCDLTAVAPGARAPADPRKVQALLGLGASLVANHIHKVSPEVAAICRALEQEFAARCVANVYCSFRQIQAFSTHFDLHDVFALQVEGEKLWHVYEARADNPVSPVPPGDEAEQWLIANRGKTLFEFNMRPGDILYLPRGQYHDAITGAAASLHVTFGLEPATGLSLFKLLESVAARESEFRAYLPDARDGDALNERLERLGGLLGSLMTSPAFCIDVLNHQRSLRSSPAGFDLPRQKRPQFFTPVRRAAVLPRGEGYVAVAEGAEIPLGATYPAIAWLLQQRMFSLDDLMARYPFVDEAELRPVLQAMVKTGVLAETDMR
jgi:ribosomal protein L16 Arg81 hydroxylase